MGNGDPQWGNGNRSRGNAPSFTNNKSPNYSPSASYNYNPSGQVNYQQSQQQSHQNQHQHQPQHPRRRGDRYKRESMNQTERILKQNDVIIRLLKEIRDRLPQGGGQGQGSHSRPKRRPLREHRDANAAARQERAAEGELQQPPEAQDAPAPQDAAQEQDSGSERVDEEQQA